MSIGIDEFEERSADELRELSNPERVIAFLAGHPDRAWKAAEIAERAGVHENSIHPVLSRLEDRGLVRHKGPYWAITDDEKRVRRAYDHHRTTELFDARYGEEDRGDWLDPADAASK